MIIIRGRRPLHSAHSSPARLPPSPSLLKFSFHSSDTHFTRTLSSDAYEERERKGSGGSQRGTRKEIFLLKQKLVWRAIGRFFPISITVTHWGLFYTSSNIKQLEEGGELWALHRLQLALIYLFVQQEARWRPPDIRGFLA